MVKKLLVLFLSFNCYFTYAETIKTDVLVIGNGVSAVTAAIQCARSKVKTVLIVKGAWLEDMQGHNMITINAGRYLPSGTWGIFRQQIHAFYKNIPGYDTAYNTQLKFEPYIGAAILKKMADTVKNLTIKSNAPFTSIKKEGTGWEVSITINGETELIKTKVVVDATENGEVVKKAGATFPQVFNEYSEKLYRTAIVAGDNLPGKKAPEIYKANYPSYPAYYIPVNAVVVKDADNLLITEALPAKDGPEYLPVQMALGQGVATIAAYAAFFKTTTKNLRVRTIQGELLDFKGYLLPFDDISPADRYFRAIQQIGATGLLKGVQKTNNNKETQFLFLPDSAVRTAEIKPVLTEIYSRAFLWFNKIKPGGRFTVSNLLSLISEITLTDQGLLQASMKKEWKSKYKFSSDFELDRPVTRREFAILANQFLNPFARAVDLEGRVIN